MEIFGDSPKEEYATDIEKMTCAAEGLSLENNPDVAQKICMFYSKYGYCKFGSKCKYRHCRWERKSVSFKQNGYLNQNYKIVENACGEVPRRYVNISDAVPRVRPSSMNNYNKNRTVYRKPCRYFKAGNCDNGANCHYDHCIEKRRFPPTSCITSNSVKSSCNFKAQRKSIPNCRYFQKGLCHKGDHCKYYHHQKPAPKENSELLLLPKNADSNENVLHPSILDNDNSVTTANAIPRNETKVVINANKIYDVPSLSEDEILQLRNTELSQLKKRFPNCEINEKSEVFSFEFQPTDPDWSHDVTNFQLQATFPENYPLTVCKIDILPLPSAIPDILLSHLNQSISEWLNRRHKLSREIKKVELLFRPFLKWFDKNLDELFSTGLKKATQNIFLHTTDDIECVSVNKHCSSNENLMSEDLTKFENCPLVPVDFNTSEVQVSHNSETYQSDSSEQIKTHILPAYLAQKLGVNILFKGLEFVEGLAALSCTKLAIMLHCARCKTSCNIKTLPNKNNSITCTKCSKTIQCNFNPSIMHQFSNVAGTIYLVECQGIDVNLVECAFLADCLNCSKQVSVQGLHYGPKQKLWCTSCNQKLVISIESSKFQASSHTYTTVKTTAVKKVEKKKDPLIKEGGPLPEFGACKHYKKSNRWLRFPCCGRVYPCDVCHEEKEMGHEMKYASRMICGFCSKEQPYTKDKPCSSCSSNVTYKSGAHWEGGKGCRNKIKMSRDDPKKYAGRSKTVSKKAQNSGKKKK